MSKVSVVIPAYNCEKYIAEAIDSVFAQTYQDFEIVVIDDGSKDGTREIIKKYGGKVRYCYQENRGVSAARNRGIAESNGKYIAFLDNDDIWFPEKLALQVPIMEADSAVGMVFTDGEYFNDKGDFIRRTFRQDDAEQALPYNESLRYRISRTEFNDGAIIRGYFHKDLYLGNSVFQSSVLVRKKCLKEVGDIDGEYVINSDYDLWIRIALRYPIVYLNKVTASWRVREDSQSGRLSLRNANYRRWDGLLFEKHLKLCAKEHQGLIRKRIYECYRDAALIFFHNNQILEARRLARKSLLYKIQPKLCVYFLFSFLPSSVISLIKNVKGLKRAKKRE